MAKDNGKVKVNVDDMSPEDKQKAKEMFKIRVDAGFAAKRAEELKKKVDAFLLTVIEKYQADTIVDDDIGYATYATTMRTSINEEKLIEELKKAGLSEKKAITALANSKEEKESSPFIRFTQR